MNIFDTLDNFNSWGKNGIEYKPTEKNYVLPHGSFEFFCASNYYLNNRDTVICKFRTPCKGELLPYSR